MKDGIIKGTGNSRYLKSVSDFLSLYPSYEDFANALVNGNLPIDMNGINQNGWDLIGTALTKGNLMSDETSSNIFGNTDDKTVNEALNVLSDAAIVENQSIIPAQFVSAINPDSARIKEVTSVVFDGERFVATTGNYGSASGQNLYGVLQSTDGNVWSVHWVFPTRPSTIAYGNGIYLVGSTKSSVMRSTDRLNWETYYIISEESTKTVPTIEFVLDKFICSTAFASTDPSVIKYSFDGINFETPNYPADITTMYSFVYGNGVIVAGGGRASNAADGVIIYSIDGGLNWEEANIVEPATIRGISFGNGRFVAISDDMTFVSFDGVNWEPTTGNQLDSILFANRTFFAISASQQKFLYSHDGFNWAEYISTFNNRAPADISYGNNVFVACGNANAGTLQFSNKYGVLTSLSSLPYRDTIASFVAGAPDQTSMILEAISEGLSL